ncbi:MAG: SWIM zinc finger family protein [Bacteroidetes bacterium]|nr:SWIM zinc finger family protein [Bacteroidota bacterium]
MQLTEEQILAMAPDDSSRKSGKDLSNPSKWVSKGANDLAIWGECQGSGSKPYQTQVDRTNIAFKCSCPSRKFPCKHGIGLLLLHARQGNTFTQAELPQWVSDWLGKRTEREEKKTEKKEKPVDEAAKVKRQQAREQSVEGGMQELLLWMKDIIRNGILGMPEKGPAFFENMARRMVDAKAPGLAGMIKTLGNINFYKEGWQTVFLDQLGRIYLVITGFRNKSLLPEDLQEDLRGQLGFTQSQEELKTQAGVTDEWLVLGKQVTEEDNLTIERNWLYGLQSRRPALVLQFSVRSQGISFSLTPGMSLHAELVFYPSVQPLRAIIKNSLSTGTMKQLPGLDGWKQVAEEETLLNAQLPFRTERPFIIQNIKPVFHSDRWWLADAANDMVRLADHYKPLYSLLSVSGGAMMDMAVLGRESSYEPLGIWTAGHYITLG